LLGSLSTDELARYGQIAYDQYQRELRYRWAQVLVLLLAGGGLIATARLFVLWGYSRTGVLALGLLALLSYWPYRGAKVRRLWWMHHRAVEKELERRRTTSAD
jgi:hypothetical protein